MPLHSGHDHGKSLSVLAPELLEHVCSYLRTVDLKSVRLVSHKMNDAAIRFVLNFVHVDLLQASFDQLDKISKHPVLSCHVQTLEYVPALFESHDSLDEFKESVLCSLENPKLAQILGVTSPEDFEEGLSEDNWQKHYDEYEHQCDVQEDLLRGSYIESSMSKAFSACPKLEKVIIAPFTAEHLGLFASRLMRQTLRDGTLLSAREEPEGIAAHHPILILKAAAIAGVTLKDLMLKFNASSFFDDSTICELCSTTTFAGLRSLRLAITLEDDPSTSWNQGFVNFLKSCQALEILEVLVQDAFVPQRQVNISLGMSGDNLSLANLRSIMLHGFALQQNRLYGLIAARQPRLARIDLWNCPLKAGSWPLLHKKLKVFFPDSEQGTDRRALFFRSNNNAPMSSIEETFRTSFQSLGVV